VLVLAAALRFYQLDVSSLWNDEGNSWAMLARSYRQIAAAAAADIHPPGYYWLLKLWSTLFGDERSSDARVVCPAGGVFGRAGGGPGPTRCRKTGWLEGLSAAGCLFAALNPFQIYYSQEARMYLLLAVEGAGLAWQPMG
jgi:hypothetical protein